MDFQNNNRRKIADIARSANLRLVDPHWGIRYCPVSATPHIKKVRVVATLEDYLTD
jgi:hypothetical protein